MAEYISQRQPLGGLLFLLPQMLSSESRDGKGRADQNFDEQLMRSIVVELEQFLIHANIPVSETNIIFVNLLMPA